ncbi:MAG: sensor histidine kinase [Actinomycetota bacterium]
MEQVARGSDELIALALRSVRVPQTGIASLLASFSPRLGTRLLAVYLLPPTAEDAELLAAGGPDAATAGPPGKASPHTTKMVKHFADELDTARAGPDTPLHVPWQTYDSVTALTSLLDDASICVVIAAGSTEVDARELRSTAAPIALLAHLIVQERELGLLRNQLHDLGQERFLLAATMQHDLRSPLTAIAGCARTLETRHEQLTPEERAYFLDCVVRQSERLERMISEAFLKDSFGPNTPLQPRRVALDEVVERVAAAGTAGRPGKVIVEAPEIAVTTDTDRLERALLNLLDNALRYAPHETSVHLIVAPQGAGATITVADSGNGVDPNVLPRLFGAYATDPSRADGTGLGLHSARRLVEDLRGRIDYSRVSGWTRFSVYVPSLEGDS